MPYLAQEKKDFLDSECDVRNLSDKMTNESIQDFVGYLNYLNFVFVKRWIKKNGNKYFVFAAIIGTLICCILEIYRKLVAPYEDEKILENRDVE